MNIVVEKQPKCVATLRVEIPADKVSGQRDQIVKGYANKARISGFRPGKAPRSVVEQRFQKEISDELNEALINEAYGEALKQESLNVLNFGTPEDLTTHENGSMTFVATLTLAPDVKLPEYKDIHIKTPLADVPDEEIDAQLKALQESRAEFIAIEDRGAAMEDFVVIDYTSTVEGKSAEEFLGKNPGQLGSGTDFWIRLTEESFLPGFSEQLVGTNAGDTREVTITLPEDFPVAELREKSLVYQITLKELKTAVLPELDDALANELAPGKTLEDVKSIIREKLAGERERKIADFKVKQLLAHFNEQVDFELPDELVAQETQNQANAIVQQSVKSGMSQGEITSYQTEIFATAGKQAVTSLRTNFILQEIARAENITVSDNELVNHLVQIANSRKAAPKKFIKDLQRAERIPSIRSSMVIGKAIDFLLEHANVEESAEIILHD